MNVYNDALLPHVVPRIFEIAVLILKRDYHKINFSLEELDEIIYYLKHSEDIDSSKALNFQKQYSEEINRLNSEKVRLENEINSLKASNKIFPTNAEINTSQNKNLNDSEYQNRRNNTLNNEIYPDWWWNQREREKYDDDYSDSDSEKEHRPRKPGEIASKRLRTKLKKLYKHRKYNDDEIFNSSYTMNKLTNPLLKTSQSNTLNNTINPKKTNVSYKMTFDKNMNIQNMRQSKRKGNSPDVPRVKYVYQGGEITRIKDGIRRTNREGSPMNYEGFSQGYDNNQSLEMQNNNYFNQF